MSVVGYRRGFVKHDRPDCPRRSHTRQPSHSWEAPPERVVILDGDTIAIGSERIRLLDIDSPESFRSRCEAELIAGLKTKERLAQLVRAGPVEIERSSKRDRYRRTLARIYVAGRDIGAVPLREGLALPYTPGAAAKAARLKRWCG